MSAESDFKRASARMKEIAKRVRNMEPALKVAAADLSTFVDDRFETSSDPAGAAWTPLAPSTLRKRGARGTRSPRRGGRRTAPALSGIKPLVDTGRLRQSINVAVGPNSLEVGTNVVYGGVHQFGGIRKPIPARPYLPIVKTGSTYTINTAGAAGVLWRDIYALVREYVATGKVK